MTAASNREQSSVITYTDPTDGRCQLPLGVGTVMQVGSVAPLMPRPWQVRVCDAGVVLGRSPVKAASTLTSNNTSRRH